MSHVHREPERRRRRAMTQNAKRLRGGGQSGGANTDKHNQGGFAAGRTEMTRTEKIQRAIERAGLTARAGIMEHERGYYGSRVHAYIEEPNTRRIRRVYLRARTIAGMVAELKAQSK